MERQADAAERWCQAKGHQLNADLRLSDAGLSAFKGDHLSKGALGRFLEMAQAGDLGPDPILLVEAIDRLSRLEAIDGLQDVLLALVRAGVTIVSLEDSQEYSRKTLREDGSKLIILVVKCQAAHEYSQRLSRRITAAWDQATADLARGVLRRVEFHRPPWCQMNGDQMELIPERVETVQKVFDYSRIDGAAAVATRLNKEGIAGFGKSGQWTRSIVRKLLIDTRVWGAITINQASRLGVATRERMVSLGKEEQIFPGLLPVAIPKTEVDEVLGKRTTRTAAGSENGRRGKCWSVAGGFTRCSCGAAASLSTTVSRATRKLGPDGKPETMRYIRCSARCGAKGYKVGDLNRHLLVRLKAGQLQQLLSDGGRSKEIKAERSAVDRLQVELAKAEQAETNAATMFKAAMKAGDVDPLHREALDEARNDAKSVREALTTAQQRLANLTHAIDSESFQTALADLYKSFLKGEDTPDQRAAINRLLQQSGLRVTLHREQRLVGIAIGDGEPEWLGFDDMTPRFVMERGGTDLKPGEADFIVSSFVDGDGDEKPARLKPIPGNVTNETVS